MAGERVVIIGGGFAGLYAAQCLGTCGKDVLVIDKTNHHLFQPLLYQVATAALSASDIAIPIRDVLRNQRNAAVVMGEAAAVDRGRRRVVLKDGSDFGYDQLIVAVGTETSYFGREDWAKRARGLKTLGDAQAMRDAILRSFEKAETARNPRERERHLTFVIVGGGPTGLELSGAIAEMARRNLRKNFRSMDPAASRIYLIEARDRVLPSFPEELSLQARKDLERLGVTVLTSQAVLDVGDDFVRLAERSIATSNIFWTAGTKAHHMLATLKVPRDSMGRVIVNPDLSIPGDPAVFVIGDAAACRDEEGGYLPGIAPVAIQQARHVCRIVSGDVPPEERAAFSYRDKGMLATIGRVKAVARIGRFTFRGFPAWLLWILLHILYLICFRNKLIVIINWLYLYVAGRRGSRIIQGQDEESRE